MTEIYKPESAEGFEFCHPERQADFETLNRELDGTRREGTWQSPPMRLVRVDRGKRLARSDAPWLGSYALIFRRATIGALEPLLRENGELLPIECPDADLLVFNPTRVLDALDEQASEVQRFSSGRIMRVQRYAFRPELIAGVDVFKIPNLRVSPTFLSERFVQAWTAASLRGLIFDKIWSG